MNISAPLHTSRSGSDLILLHLPSDTVETETPAGMGGGVLLTVKRPKAGHWLVTRMCLYWLEGPADEQEDVHCCRIHTFFSRDTTFAGLPTEMPLLSFMLHSTVSFFIPSSFTTSGAMTYWIGTVLGFQFCIIFSPRCIWYCQLARLYSINLLA